MMICEPGDIVIVPFPFTDRLSVKRRPAVVLSRNSFNTDHHHTVLAMITTASHTRWKTDHVILDMDATGLLSASVVRMKIFTLDNRLILKRVGVLHAKDWKAVSSQLREGVFALP